MCLAIPARVVSIDKDAMATVEVGGVMRTVSLDLVPEVQVGDFVIVHVGFAIQRLDEAAAEATLSLFKEIETSQTDVGD